MTIKLHYSKYYQSGTQIFPSSLLPKQWASTLLKRCMMSWHEHFPGLTSVSAHFLTTRNKIRSKQVGFIAFTENLSSQMLTAEDKKVEKLKATHKPRRRSYLYSCTLVLYFWQLLWYRLNLTRGHSVLL